MLAKSLEDRLMKRVHKIENGCWEWLGCLVHGYGQMSIGGGKTETCHRVSYQIYKGAIPKGMHLDHLCRNPKCVNPNHLEVVTPKENTMRGLSPNVVLHHRGKCKNGHDINDINTCFRANGSVKHCRICQREQQNKRERRFRPEYSSHDINNFKDDGFAYYRLYYDVPVMTGVRVNFDGKWGTVTRSRRGYIVVMPDERKNRYETWHCHPTWHMEYFPNATQVKECELRRRAYWSIAYPDRPYQEKDPVQEGSAA